LYTSSPPTGKREVISTPAYPSSSSRLVDFVPLKERGNEELESLSRTTERRLFEKNWTTFSLPLIKKKQRYIFSYFTKITIQPKMR
jgi:hypothetical protein